MRRVRTGAVLAILAGGPNLVAAEDWVMAKTTNFVVVSDAGEKSARRVARQFEIFRELFRSVLNARAETTRPLVVLATRDESGMKELLPRHYRVKGGVHPAGIFMGGGDMHHIALRLDVEGAHPYQVVYHEYTHLLIRGSFPQVPLWLNEGLAEFYASAEIDETDVRFGQLFPRHVRLLRERTMLPVSKLLAIDASSPEYNESSRVGAFYAGAA